SEWHKCDSLGCNCADTSGSTGSTYLLRGGDVGSTLRVMVTATNSIGSASSTSDASGIVVADEPPSDTALPAISGVTQQGQTLTASTGEWSGTPPLEYTYQWQSCNSLGESCLDVPAATSASYTLGASELAMTMRVIVTATNSGGSVSATSEASEV